MSRVAMLLVGVSALMLGGCGAVSSAVDTTFKIAHGIGSLSAAGTKHTFQTIDGGVKIAKGGVELTGDAMKLLDQMGEAGHRSRMRNVEYARAIDSPKRLAKAPD